MRPIPFIGFQHEPKRLAAILICLLAFLALLVELVSSFWGLSSKPFIIKPALAINNQQPIRADSPLFNTPFFGDYVPTNLADAEIKQSMLDVQVVGIMFANKEKDSQVILRAGGGEEKFYVVGDSLPGGAVIKRITKQGAVVLHNGSLELLSLPKSEFHFDEPAKPLLKE